MPLPQSHHFQTSHGVQPCQGSPFLGASLDDTRFVGSPRSQALFPRKGSQSTNHHVLPNAEQFTLTCCPVCPVPQGHEQLTLCGIMASSSWSQTLWPRGASMDWTQRSLSAHPTASPSPPCRDEHASWGPLAACTDAPYQQHLVETGLAQLAKWHFRGPGTTGRAPQCPWDMLNTD